MKIKLNLRANLSIARRFMVLLVGFAVIPMLTLGLFTQVMLQEQTRERIQRNANEMLSHMAANVRMIKQSTENCADMLATNDALCDIASELYYRNVSREWEIDSYRSILKLIHAVRINEFISEVKVYLPSGSLITWEESAIFPLDKAAGLSSGWRDDGAYLHYTREGAYSNGKYCVIIDIAVAKQQISEIFGESGGMEMEVWMTDSEGKLLVGERMGQGENQLQIQEIGQWRIWGNLSSGVIPLLSPEVVAVFLSLAVVSILIVLIANYVSKRISRELHALEQACEAAQAGHYTLVETNGSTREVRKLQLTFNSMMNQIETLLYDVYEAETAKHYAYMETMVEQIKPHFLHNTLEYARALAYQSEDITTANFLRKLGMLLKLLLNEGREIIPLSRELKHAKLYVEIMNLRLGGSIRLDMDVPEELSETPVLRLILQPLVENAIEHGLRETTSKGGSICVTARRENGGMALRILDDGVGIAEEMLGEYDPRRVQGYGTQNVYRRLKLHYEENMSMRYERNVPQGTILTVWFTSRG